MTVVTRFAPSPTGRLHVGNIRAALHNYLFARKHGGTFILRIDDTDRERSTAEFDEAIRDDLTWLGLEPDRIVRQSERFDLYEREFERLKRPGGSIPATRLRRSSTCAARSCSVAGCRRSTSAGRPTRRRPSGARRTGASSSIMASRSCSAT